jgi:hypothetical protein
MGVANAFRHNDPQLMTTVAMSSMLHDVGELYIDPEIIKSHEYAAPAEWIHYSAHPVIGATLAREVMGLDVTVQNGVLEHHETLDGFGYPRALHSHCLSAIGSTIGIAEFISSLILQDEPYHRIDIALKFMPGEFEPIIVNSISELLHESMDSHVQNSLPQKNNELPNRIHRTLLGMGTVLETYDRLCEHQYAMGRKAWQTLEHAFERFILLQRAFASTGIESLPTISEICSNTEIDDYFFEARCVLHEITWRCVKLAREIATSSVRTEDLSAFDRECLMDFANALAGAS